MMSLINRRLPIAPTSSRPWPASPPTGRLSVGLLLLSLHGGLALLLWQASALPRIRLAPEPRPLTWVTLGPAQPERLQPPTPQSAHQVEVATATPRHPTNAEAAHPQAALPAAWAADKPAPNDSRASSELTAVNAGPEQTSNTEAPPRTPPLAPRLALAAPIELPSSALRYVVPPAQAYPLQSQRLGEQGTVWLRLVVNAEGLPTAVALARSSGFARLDEQALQAMRAARFAPHIDNGQALEWTALASLSYELE